MFGVIDILVSNKVVVCCDTFILIADTMQYNNAHMKKSKKIGYLDVLKNKRIQRMHLDIE